MSAVEKLYDDVILDHIKNVRNYRELSDATQTTEGVNPLCGDTFSVYLHIESEVIRDAAFQCSCCGISMASASIMTESVRGKTLVQARELYSRFVELLTHAENETVQGADLGQLAVLGTVRQFPSRVNCAILPWHTMAAALDGKPSTTLTA